jgi:regulator of replication initiation timing|tara:strand:- start:623 stop:859 length:237 start_codon:yes stop_codon:yes gene_type:complete
MTKLDKALSELSDTQEKLISDFFNLKKDFAFKVEELQAMYLENKNLHKKIESLEKENHSFKQQIKQLEQEAEEMLLYP